MPGPSPYWLLYWRANCSRMVPDDMRDKDGDAPSPLREPGTPEFMCVMGMAPGPTLGGVIAKGSAGAAVEAGAS